MISVLMLCALSSFQQLEFGPTIQPSQIWTSNGTFDAAVTTADGKPIQEHWTKQGLDRLKEPLPEGQGLALLYELPTDGVLMLTCKGHNAIYGNNVTHPRDPGAIGAHQWPFPVQKGANWIFIEGNSKPLLLSARPVAETSKATVNISQYDRTIPQAIDLIETNALGAMVVSNLTEKTIRECSLWARCLFKPNEKYVGRLYPEDWKPGEWTQGSACDLQPYASQKVELRLMGPPPFKVDPQPYPFELELRTKDGEVLGKSSVNLAVREHKDRTWETFRSEIDGSIQRWIKIPRTGNHQGPNPAIFVVPHIRQSISNQALSYEPSEQHDTFVCWGRRPSPNGHNDEFRREALLETIEAAIDRHGLDRTRIGLLGFGEAGLTAFELQRQNPSLFSGVAAVSTFPPIDMTTGSNIVLNELPGRLYLRWGSEYGACPPDAKERYEYLAAADQLRIEIVAGEGEWWGRETVDVPQMHEWILEGNGDFHWQKSEGTKLPESQSEAWTDLDAATID